MSRLVGDQMNLNIVGFHPPHRARIETHCEQIFQRASSINKDLIHRMQNVPIAKKHVFGLEIKKIWILVTLLLLFSCSLIGTILFWCTDTVDTVIMEHLVIRNGSEMYESFSRPKVKTIIKVHIFNYTNVEAFEKGLEKRLRVKDLGPYVYEETVVRQNIHFESDGTVTYQNVFKHKFLPHLSKGKQNDIVIVPNIMVLTTAQKTKDLDYWARLAASMTLGGFMNQKPFMKLAAHRFIWGYDDQVYDWAKGFLSFQNANVLEQMGLMSQRNGTSPYIYTVHTGQKGMKNYGVISKVNGFEEIGHWSTPECDSLSASDGSLFPPNAVRSKQTLNIYVPDICRKIPYVFQKEVFIINNTVPAYRYVMPESIFDSPEYEPSNQCYCDLSSGTCPPQGFYNLSACVFGAPIFMSLPHFKRVDPANIKVDGINPKQGDFSSYMDVHPTMGFPIVGMSRLQANILARSYPGFYPMDIFEEGDVMLPLAWMETGLEERYINREYLEVIYLTTFTVKQVEMAIKYITLLTTLITMTAIFIIMKARIQTHRRRGITSPTIRINV